MKTPGSRVPVLDAGQAAAWDAASITAGIPSRVLMETAGRATAAAIAERFPEAMQRGVIVAAGAGNNGGDGWVVARALHALGATVTVVDEDRNRSEDCEGNRALALSEGVRRIAADRPWPATGVVVDALLGTGAAGPPRGVVGALAARVMEVGAPVVAIDGPTGLDLTSGEAHGPVRADLTMTFGGLRRGHLAARSWCGTIRVAEIGFAATAHDQGWPVYVDRRFAANVIPPFDAAMHKGRRGKILLIGGDEGMAGALRHAATASFAAGAGLVRLATAAASVAPLQETVPDATAMASALGSKIEPALSEAIAWSDVVAIGPGLGREEPRRAFVRAVLEQASGPVVIDADALQVGRDALRAGAGPHVLTPHAGEFRSLFDDLDPGADPYASAERAAVLASQEGPETVVLLKGVPTIVAGGPAPLVIGAGNPALATGGSGDVLTGVVAALLARGVPPADAAAAGAYAMGRAAEHAAKHRGVTVTRPADVIESLGAVWMELTTPMSIVPPVLLDLEPPQLT